MGDAERAMDVEQFQREKAIEHERTVPKHLAGPVGCVKCGKSNDRRDKGFAVCTSCMVEAAR